MSDLKKSDFEFLESEHSVQQISRVSLSYWQDSWLRFKKNRRALISLIIIIFLLFVAFIGPYVWDRSPTDNDFMQISRPPSLGAQSSLVVDRYRSPKEIEEVCELECLGTPNTEYIELLLPPINAEEYMLYRNEFPPEDIYTLGIKLAGFTDEPHYYVDQLKLEPIDYYYSLAYRNGDDINYFTHKVTPVQAVLLAKAEKHKAGVKVGEYITITAEYPFGTDELGQDMLARIIHGSRISLLIGLIAPFFTVVIGMIYGGIAGYIGGKVDSVMMRVADFVIALPFLLFMILLRMASGIETGESGISVLIFSLIILRWPGTARLMRGQVMQLRHSAYIQAARMLGGGRMYLLFRHIIPNTMGVILVTFTFAVPAAIFTEAFLSFIGLGVVPPTPSWGSMCSDGTKVMMSYPWQLIIPAVFISITVLAFNLVGDGLRDALDSKMRSR